MKPYIHHSFRSLLLPILGVAAVVAPPAVAGGPQFAGPKSADQPARRMTMVRVGYGQAKPDSASLSVPFQVEGETWDAVERARLGRQKSLETAIVAYIRTPNAVYVRDGQSGQIYREGRPIITYTGHFSVCVRDLSQFKPILAALEKETNSTLTVQFMIADRAKLKAAAKRAQLSAIAAANREGETLAKAAGTRIAGIWEVREGAVRAIEPKEIAIWKPEDREAPHEIDAMSACITIVYELAPPKALSEAPKPSIRP